MRYSTHNQRSPLRCGFSRRHSPPTNDPLLTRDYSNPGENLNGTARLLVYDFADRTPVSWPLLALTSTVPFIMPRTVDHGPAPAAASWPP